MSPPLLTALPVFNEVETVDGVLDEVLKYSDQVLVVDDGSTDGTAERLARRGDVKVIRHRQNLGYGAALRTAFEYAQKQKFEVLVTIDCDGQHEPQRIPAFATALTERKSDMISGSRYLDIFDENTLPPAERRQINVTITEELNALLGLRLTDAFCGFKAYRVASLRQLNLTETGYAMPLELWIQAAAAGWQICELPVPLIYLDATRSFGGALDEGTTRLTHYREVIERSLAALPAGEAERFAGFMCPDLSASR